MWGSTIIWPLQLRILFSCFSLDFSYRLARVDEMVKIKVERGKWPFGLNFYQPLVFSPSKTITAERSWAKKRWYEVNDFLYSDNVHIFIIGCYLGLSLPTSLLDISSLLRRRRWLLALHKGGDILEPACYLAWLRYTKRIDNPDIAQTIRRKLVGFWGGF